MTLLARNTWQIFSLTVLAALSTAEAEPAKTTSPNLVTISAARGQARILHETIHGTLRVIHRDFYREDERLPIPSATMQTVFDELAQSHQVQVHWLAVNTPPMNVENAPRDDFEKAAVKALTEGKEEFERVTDGVYRHVGTIVLSSQCLKCHLPNRTSTHERAAGLVIAIPVKPD